MIVTGKNAVAEALRGGASCERLYLKKDSGDEALNGLAALAGKRGVPVSFEERDVLDRLAGGEKHRGAVLIRSGFAYSSLEDILGLAAERGEKPFVVILDEIADPQNLGAIIRTAECAGVHGVVIPERRGAGVTGTVLRQGAGAPEHVPVAKVRNVNDAVKRLKALNVFVYAAEAGGPSVFDADLTGAAAIVIGSEGKGVRRLTRELCDGTVSIPMKGRINSLNASAAAAVVIYEKVRQDALRGAETEKNSPENAGKD